MVRSRARILARGTRAHGVVHDRGYVPLMHVRVATAADMADVGAIDVVAWQAAYRGLLDGDALARHADARARTIRHAARYAAGTAYALVVDTSDQVLAYACYGPSRTHAYETLDGGRVLAADAEMYALYAQPEAWGRGCGRMLVAHAVADLARGGHRHLDVLVLTENARARRAYERAGMHLVVDGLPIEHLGACEALYRKALPAAGG